MTTHVIPPSEGPLALLIDWGSTNLRAYLVRANGQLVTCENLKQGIKHMRPMAFEDTVRQLMRDAGAHGALSAVLLAGMVGSELGWKKVDLVKCPASVDGVARALHQVAQLDKVPVYIVPGMFNHDAHSTPGMMRGEEVQIFGALAGEPNASGLYCLPGTHTKWVTVEQGKVRRIITAMTGEIFSFLANESILASVLGNDDAGPIDMSAFARGLASAASGPGVLQTVFNCRVQSVLGIATDPKALRSETSGLLIGGEVCAIVAHLDVREPVRVISSERLGGLYLEALRAQDHRGELIDDTAAFVRGGLQLLGSRTASQSEPIHARPVSAQQR